jgi:phenylpyruvate tautomerase PptA (4-oxalocrotonate tautomerase family)
MQHFASIQEDVERKTKKLRAQYILIEKHTTILRNAFKRNRSDKFEVSQMCESKIGIAENIKEEIIQDFDAKSTQLINLGHTPYAEIVKAIPHNIEVDFAKDDLKRNQKLLKSVLKQVEVLNGRINNENRRMNGKRLMGQPTYNKYSRPELIEELEELEMNIEIYQNNIKIAYLKIEGVSEKEPEKLVEKVTELIVEKLEEKSTLVTNIEESMSNIKYATQWVRNSIFKNRNKAYTINNDLMILYRIIEDITGNLSILNKSLVKFAGRLKDKIIYVNYPMLNRLPKSLSKV